VEIHVVVQHYVAGVDLQDCLPAPDVRLVHGHVPVESSGAKERRIENLRAVGGRHDDHPRIGFETVHLHQELVQGLFAFVVASHGVEPPSLSQGVQLIDEDDARGVLFRLGKKVPHPCGSHAHKHLDKVGTAHAEKRNPRFPRHRLGQQRLARARSSHQEHALGNFASKALEFFRVFQKFHNLLEFRLGLLDPRHIVEGDAHLLFRVDLHAGLADGKHALGARPHPAHEETPEGDEQSHGQQPRQDGFQPFVLQPARIGNPLLVQEFHQLGVFHPHRHEQPAGKLAFHDFAFDFVGLQDNVTNSPFPHQLLEVRIGQPHLLLLQHVVLEPGNDEQGQKKVPEGKVHLAPGGIRRAAAHGVLDAVHHVLESFRLSLFPCHGLSSTHPRADRTCAEWDSTMTFQEDPGLAQGSRNLLL